MAKIRSSFPLGKSEKVNVAVQRSTTNIKEAENLGEQAVAEANAKPTFSKHGTFGPPVSHTLEKMWSD